MTDNVVRSSEPGLPPDIMIARYRPEEAPHQALLRYTRLWIRAGGELPRRFLFRRGQRRS